MNAWMSSPSPSLDAMSAQSSSSPLSAFVVGWHVASTLPRRLWDAYVAYLWCYQPNSWVGRLASTFRILAVILVLPVVLLTLLDVTSYVIARTLGIVDDVKASTSDVDTGHANGTRCKMGVAVRAASRVPTARRACPSSSSSSSCSTTTTTTTTTSSMSSSVSHGIGVDRSVCVSEGLVPEGDLVERGTNRDENAHGCVSKAVVASTTTHAHAHVHTGTDARIQSQTAQTRVDRDVSDASRSPQAYYFTGEEDLRLAGEGVFSPAVSMPPSPLTPRMPLYTFTEGDGREVGQVSEEIVLRRRVQSAQEDEPGDT